MAEQSNATAREQALEEALAQALADKEILVRSLEASQHRERQLLLEKQLHGERNLFELLVRTVVDYAIVTLDASGKVLTWNKGAEGIKGYDEHEIVGQPYRQFFLPEDAAAGKPEQLLARAAAEGHVQIEGWRQRKDGTKFWADAVITALRDEHGELIGYAKVTRDLTERKAAEDTIRQLNASLEASNLHKDQFLSIVSHELRTPLNSILGFGSMLDDELVGALTMRQHHYVKRMLAGGDTLLKLINDLLDMSRIQAGKFSIRRQPLRLRAIADDLVESVVPQVEQKRLTLVNEVPADLPTLSADPQRIAQVVRNLLSNAIKFTPEGGHIWLRARVDGPEVRVEVTDTGLGIAAADLPKLFQRFGQLDMSNTRSAPGTGLGLSIVKAFVEAHGGHVGVESTPGVGSTFWFTLPLEAPQAA